MTEPLIDEPRATSCTRADLADPHGRAALLLVESLIHGLVARSSISIEDAVDIIGTAVDIQEEIAVEADLVDSPATTAHTLLEGIAASFSLDLPHGITMDIAG